MASSGTSRISAAILWIIAIVVALILASAIYFYRNAHTAIVVRTARVERTTLSTPVSTNGKVEPESDFQPHAPIASVIDKLAVHLGQNVTRGQQLMQLDASEAQSHIVAAQATLQANRAALANMQQGGTEDELLAERADLAAAQTQLTQSTAALSTLQGLQGKGAASANEVASAQTRVLDARAHLAQLQTRQKGRYGVNDLSTQHAQIAQAQAALAAARSDFSGVDIRAPFAGTVYSLPVAAYDFVQAGQALIDVADLSRLRIRAYFDEPEIGKLADGESVEISWDAKPDHTWHGHVQQAPTTVITYGTRNVGECLISVDDAHGDLLPNTNVTVVVTTSSRANVLSLPREALHTEGAVDFVFRIVNDRLVRTPVQVGVVNLTHFEIISGLSEGDPVALGGTTPVDLTNGLRVQPQN